MVGLRCAIVDLPERSVDPVLLTHIRRQADKCLWLRVSYIVEFVLPPTLVACPAARCVVEACPQPGRPRSGCSAGLCVPRGSHGACTSTGTAMATARRSRTAARPAHGRPSCCKFRVVCTHPVSRPGRVAHSTHEARPEPVMATYSAVSTQSRRAWLRSALRAPCDRARYPMRASPRCRSPHPPRRTQRAYSPPQARGPRVSGRDGATRSG